MNDPIRPTKLADVIAVRLERLILEGALRPGERLLPERELAQKFDVSRPSLREAQDKLEKRGLLFTGAGGGTYVAPLLGEDFIAPLLQVLQTRPEATFDYLEFRAIVDGATAYLASLRSTHIDREEIQKRYEAMVLAHSLDDPTDEAKADAEFHIAIYEASHNMLMLHIMRSLAGILHHDILYNRTKLYLRQGVRELLLEQHRAIYEAVMSGDAPAARLAAETNVTFTRDALHEIADADARLEVSLRRIARSDARMVARR